MPLRNQAENENGLIYDKSVLEIVSFDFIPYVLLQ